MSSTERIDNAVEKIIESLAEELGNSGFFTTPTPERKTEIIEQIAKLRASMNPYQCDHK